jgi:hypothetical protein
MAYYKFTLYEPVTFVLSHKNFNKLPENVHTVFFNNKVMGYVIIRPRENKDTVITVNILSGYSWDGCTPKFKLGSIVFGVWDGFKHKKTLLPKAYNGSLVHDFLLQFKDQHSVSDNNSHTAMYLLFKRDSFELRNFYFIGVHVWHFIKRYLRWT